MLKDKQEEISDLEKEKNLKINHVRCVPCEKTLCGQLRPIDTCGPPARKPSGQRCVVCMDLWESLRRCIHCGADRHEMWGPYAPPN